MAVSALGDYKGMGGDVAVSVVSLCNCLVQYLEKLTRYVNKYWHCIA